MTTGRSDGGAARLLDASAFALFAAHAALRLSLKGGDGAWGSNLFTHILVPLAAAVWLAARALERRLPWRLTGLEIPLAVLAAAALISTFGAAFRLAAMDGTAGLCAAILAFPLAVHMFGPERRGSLLALLAALVAVAALYGGIQYIQFGDLQDPAVTARALEVDDGGELLGRIYAREPLSTFNNPNTFAGFLILLLPFVVGLALDVKSRAAKVAGVVIASIGVFGFATSGSTGAAVAGGATVFAFGLLVALRRRPEWRAKVLIGVTAVVGILAVLVIAGPLSPDSVAKRSESIAVRDVYWDAALRIAKGHPLGIGMNNFEDYYHDHKDDRQEEVRRVHNDYLQILVELGIPGLLAFLAVLGMAGGLALRPPTDEASVAASNLPMGVGLFIGLAAAFGLQGSFGDVLTMLLLAGAGLGVYWIFSRTSPGDFTKVGLAAGLAGAAVHFLVDFDFSDPSFRHVFFLALAGLAVVSRLEPPSVAGTAVPAVAAVILFALVMPLAALIAPRFIEAEDLARQAEEAEPLRADELWEAAAAANGLDPDPAVRRGLREFQRWIEEEGENPRSADLIVTVLEDALRRRPRSAAIHARLAEVQEAVARRMQDRQVSGIDIAAAQAMMAEAERHARRAVELYPTRAYHRYLLARILDASNKGTEADTEFREALRLSALATRVPRLALDGLQEATATFRTGDAGRAVAIFREWVRKQKEPRWRARLPLLTPLEKSIVDAAADSK